MVRPTHRAKRTLIALLALLGVTILWPLVEGLFSRPPQPEQIFHSQAIRIGIDPSRPPLAFFDENAEYSGLGVDLGQAIADEIGMPVMFVGLGFDGLYDALTTHQVDIVIAGLQPTFQIDDKGAIYSRHYFDAGLVLVAPEEIQSMKDLADRRLAYVFGSPADAEAHRWQRRILPFELQPYEQPTYALDAVQYHVADAALVDALTARLYLREQPQMNVHLTQIDHAWYTVAVRADREDILQIINRTLHTLSSNGRLDALLDKWL